MRTTFLWIGLGLAIVAATARRTEIPQLGPPVQRKPGIEIESVVELHVEYDGAFFEQYGDRVEDFIVEAIAIHNLEWRRYRREWFVMASLEYRPSGDVRDACYLLANFLHRTVAARGAIHVMVTGRQLEVYSNGQDAVAIGGLAYRGSDAVVVSAAPGVTVDLLAYYLFHELGHCWDAFDIPFDGGNSTFSNRGRVAFTVDAGNAEIMEESVGPRPRDARGRAPMLIRERLARARAVARETPAYGVLHDLMLHEPSPANPAYVAKKRQVLATAGADAAKISAVLQRYELTGRQLHEDAAVRRELALHYWLANDAIERRDFDTADMELEAMQRISVETGDVQMLVSAVKRKVRKRR